MKMKRFWHAGAAPETSTLRGAGHGFTAALFGPVSARSSQWVMGDAGFCFPVSASRLGFREVWAASGEFPLPARRLIESDARFAGFDVALGLIDEDAPGVAVLLRSRGHLASLRVLEALHGSGPIDAEIDAGIVDALAHAERFCAHAAILLIHAPAAWADDVAAYGAALAARGVRGALPNRLYGLDHDASPGSFGGLGGAPGSNDAAAASCTPPTLHIGWIGDL